MVYTKYVLYLLMAGLFGISLSCQKIDEDGFDNDKLVLKSQEITVYYDNDDKGSANYATLIPVKLYARGGAPQRSNGDYAFFVAKDSQLPDGLRLDPVNGVIESDGKRFRMEDQPEQFSIRVTDGVDTASATYKVIKRAAKGEKMIPPLQFSAPETTLLCKSNRGNYGVSLSMFSGTPPYTFRLMDGEILPKGLELNPQNGVISGFVAGLLPGNYIFRVECVDGNGNKAVSMCTSQKYEEFTFIVK